MSFTRYDSYKNSHLPWLGEIPSHWGISQSRRLFALRKEKATKNDRQLTASQKHGVIYQDEYMALEGQKVVQVLTGADILKHVEPNDFVVSMRSFQGGIELCKQRGCISSAYVMLIPSSSIHVKFFAYLFKCKPYIQALQSTSNLVRDGQALRYENFTLIDLPVIPCSEQRVIADFLDNETAKIDALIAEQRRLIDLLEEKRKAVISNIVTKGVNLAAPMKDSGIEGLGKVPRHWDVTPIKRFCVRITDGAHISPETENGTFCFISTKDIGNDTIDFDNCLKTSANSFEYLVRTGCRPLAGDVLFSKDGTIGRTAVVAEDRDFVVASSLIIIRPERAHVHSQFLNFLCQSWFVAAQVERFVKGAGLPRLSIQNLLKVVGVFPPLDEQVEIVRFLDDQTRKAAVLISEAELAMELLQERRTALISAAVTGKIDVRGLVEINAEEVAAE